MSVEEFAEENARPAEKTSTVIRVKGRNIVVPTAKVGGRSVILTGSLLKVARIFDEDLVEGEAVASPGAFVANLQKSALRADVLTFAQRPPDITPRFNESFEWDNWAIAPTSSFQEWWEKLPQESRKNVRRSAKRGVTVREALFDTKFVQGIRGIYNETPCRQGKRFWHYGKDEAAVRLENGTYLDRSIFVGAFCDETLIGFIKMIRVNHLAVLIQILAKSEHHDKRPMNALLAHAIEICEHRNIRGLVYGNYVYGKKNDSSLTEFKRRNGFEKVDFPRYYIPISVKGKLAISLGLHRGLRNLIPKRLNDLILGCRRRILRKINISAVSETAT